jgi:hypothetical protein
MTAPFVPLEHGLQNWKPFSVAPLIEARTVTETIFAQ